MIIMEGTDRAVTCKHPKTEPVTLPDGETVAEMCTACLVSLPVGWDCQDCDFEDLSVAECAEPIARVRVGTCPAHGPIQRGPGIVAT